MKVFITGIDTNVGKTVVAAIVALATKSDYWKPIQSGDLSDSDTIKVKKYTDNKLKYHREAIRLKEPLSPHESAAKQNKKIELLRFEAPSTDNNLVIEGAGGLMVPMNEEGDCIIDLIKHLGTPVILVAKNYLGSINHTIMSCQMLGQYGIQNLGIIISGEANPASEEIITTITGVPILGHVDWTKRITKTFITKQSEKFKDIF